MPKVKKEKTIRKLDINLDLSDEAIVDYLTNELIAVGKEIDTKDITLNFCLKKQGQQDKLLEYPISKEHYKESEREVIFPLLIIEILQKEFSSKVAQNPKLVKHVMNELRKDPYWSSQVLSLIRAIKKQEPAEIKATGKKGNK